MSDLAAKMSRQNKRPATQAAPATAEVAAKENDGETWEDRHKRYTFHLPIALMDELDALGKERSRSKSSLVAEAVQLMIDQA